MSAIRIDIKRLNKTTRYLAELPKKLKKELDECNELFMLDVEKNAKFLAPVDTGEIVESIHLEAVRQGDFVSQWKVVADSPHADFQESGFAPHTFFANPNTGFNSSRMEPYKSYFVKKNTPFLQPAVEISLTNFSSKLKDAIGRATHG